MAWDKILFYYLNNSNNKKNHYIKILKTKKKTQKQNARKFIFLYSISLLPMDQLININEWLSYFYQKHNCKMLTHTKPLIRLLLHLLFYLFPFL